MKTFIHYCLHGRRMRWAILAVAFAAGLILCQTAVSKGGQRQYKLGGAWLGKGAGTVWTCAQNPMDPNCLTAVLHVRFQAYGPAFAALADAFGADSWGDFMSEGVMINHDTEKWTLLGYGQKLNAKKELEIRAILLASGTFQFTDNDHAVLRYTVSVYNASKDSDHDGMPDPGTQPDIVVPDLMDSVQRIPILP